MKRRLRALTAMMFREMTTRYGRSAMGYLWAILEPVLFIAMFSILFSSLASKPALGSSFPLFFATGVIPFLFYREISEVTSGAFAFNRPLFMYPSISVLDAILSRFILQVLTMTFVAAIVFTGVCLIEDVRPVLDFGPILVAVGLASLLGLGVGTLNCTLFVFFPTWQRFFNVFNRPLFIVSAIFFTPEMFVAEYRDILLWNPLVHIVGAFRSGFFPAYNADYVSVPFVLGPALVLLLCGLLLLRRHEGRLLEQ